MSVTRNYARHLRVITVLQTITLQLRIVTRKVRNYAVITHFTHLQRNAGSVTRNSHTLRWIRVSVPCVQDGRSAPP